MEETEAQAGQARSSLARVLLALAGVRAGSGAEQVVARLVQQIAAPWVDEVRTDPLGSLWLIRRSRTGSQAQADQSQRADVRPIRVMLSAHMDEIGWLVRHIDERGFLRVTALGGPDVSTYLGHEVRLVTADGREWVGVVGVKPPHLTQPQERERLPEVEDLFVDIGLGAEAVRRQVRPGDIIYPAVEPTLLGEHRLTSKALDNRASVATMLWTLRLLTDRLHAAEVVAVATVQEELGMVGARTAAFSLQPDLAIALDVGFGDQPGVDRWVSLELGKGPGLTTGPNIHPRLRKELNDLAERIHVAVQSEVAAGSTGTDAWTIQVAGQGVPVALLSLPLRYMHSAAELVDVGDLEESARLLAEFIVGVDDRWRRAEPPWPKAAVSVFPADSLLSLAVGAPSTPGEPRAGVAGLTLNPVNPSPASSAALAARLPEGVPADLTRELGELSQLRGPSGHEELVRDWVQAHLGVDVDSAFVDSVGNLIVAKGVSKTGPRVLVDAHMDEVGLLVLGVDDDGLLRFRPLGGIDARVLPAQRVWVGDGQLLGVIGVKPIHLKKRDERRNAPAMEDLYIDIGAADREAAARLVKPGEFVSFATEFGPMGDGLLKGKALDDRAGVALLLQLLRQDWPFPFFAAFTVQEEVGLRGAQVAAAEVEPDWALVLEATTCADIPDVPPSGEATRLGDGPALSFRDGTAVVQPDWYEWAARVAGEAQVPFQWKRTTRGGNDAGALQRRAGSRPVLSLSVPCRYLHTPVCVLSVADLGWTYRLARALLERVSERWM